MGSPVTNTTGAVGMFLQALNNTSNQIIFNYQVLGLLFGTCADASLTQNYNINTSPLPLLPDPNNGYPLLGLYIKNNSQTEGVVVTMTWTDSLGNNNTIVLYPGGAFLQFQPSGIGVIEQVTVQSTAANTPIEYAWWATSTAPPTEI